MRCTTATTTVIFPNNGRGSGGEAYEVGRGGGEYWSDDLHGDGLFFVALGVVVVGFAACGRSSIGPLLVLAVHRRRPAKARDEKVSHGEDNMLARFHLDGLPINLWVEAC